MRTAQPLIEKTMTSHARSRPEKPMVTVKIAIASKPFISMDVTVSRALNMNISPPAVKQKAVTSSLGGRAGKCDVGGFR